MKTLKILWVFFRLKWQEFIALFKERKNIIGGVIGFFAGIGLYFLHVLFPVIVNIIMGIGIAFLLLVFYFIITDNWQKAKREVEEKNKQA